MNQKLIEKLNQVAENQTNVEKDLLKELQITEERLRVTEKNYNEMMLTTNDKV
jgi:hypothetical protein